MFWATTSASLRHATMSIKSAPRLPSSPAKGLSTASVKVATGVPFWVYRRFGSAVKRPMSITLFIHHHLQKFGVVPFVSNPLHDSNIFHKSPFLAIVHGNPGKTCFTFQVHHFKTVTPVRSIEITLEYFVFAFICHACVLP